MARSTGKSLKKTKGKQVANAKNVTNGKTKPIAKSATPPKTVKASPKAKTAIKGKTFTTKVAPKPTKTAARPQKAAKAAPAKAPRPAKRLPPSSSAKVVKAPNPKPVTMDPKPAKVPSGPKGYTPGEYVKFKEFKQKFEDMSNQALKDLLRGNYQSMSGNKDELVYKCADGATLGRIPRCPKCFGGRPKFDFQKGTYYCSGYRDDVDFKNCHSTFQLSEITRDAWTN